MFYRRGTDPIKIVLSFFTIYLLHSSWRATHTELRKIFINTDLINSVCFLSFLISEIVTRLQIWREKLQVKNMMIRVLRFIGSRHVIGQLKLILNSHLLKIASQISIITSLFSIRRLQVIKRR